jgi:hypothetical protein
MAFEGYLEYQRREFCKDLPCPVQVLLEAAPAGSKEYEQIRGICINSCIHTTYEFHHWLIQKGYLIVRPAPQGS